MLSEENVNIVTLASLGLVKELEDTIKEGKPVDAVDSDGRTALHFAVMNENIDMIQVLLNYNANVNLEDDYGDTPLILSQKSSNTAIHDIFDKKISEDTISNPRNGR